MRCPDRTPTRAPTTWSPAAPAAAQDPIRLREIYKRLDLANVDGLVLSACVQMQSLPSIDAVERESGVPTLSAAVATTWQMLRQLKLKAEVPGCGALLGGRY